MRLLPQAIAIVRDDLPFGIGRLPGLEPSLFGLVLVLVILFQPGGMNGLWLKTKHWFQAYPVQAPDQRTFRRRNPTRSRSGCDERLVRNADSVPGDKDISVRFGGIRAVDAVSFDVRQGEVFAIIGPNGAGKTTIFNLISRIYNVTDGQLVFDGHDFTRTPPHRIAGLGIARTFQNIELFANASLLQNLLIGRHCHSDVGYLSQLGFLPSTRRAEIHHREKVEEVIEFLGLQRHRDTLIANLPYGVRKVVELGRALCTEPKLLLLDEPSSGLNVEETEGMGFWIEDIKKDLGITVIMVEHDMALVSQVSDRVMALNYGKVLAMGTPGEVQTHPEVIRAYIGGEAEAEP